MANSGLPNPRVSATATLASFQFQQHHSFSTSHSLPLSLVKVGFKNYGGEGSIRLRYKTSDGRDAKCGCHQSNGITEEAEHFPEPVNQEKEGFLCNAINMRLSERLSLAWKILFPSATARRNSNARIAKQRLKMILFSDRCAVSDEAKQKIVGNVVNALSDFVEIDSHEKVQLGVSTDVDMGTLYSITVPVRRVKPVYQEEDNFEEAVTNIRHEDTSENADT